MKQKSSKLSIGSVFCFVTSALFLFLGKLFEIIGINIELVDKIGKIAGIAFFVFAAICLATAIVLQAFEHASSAIFSCVMVTIALYILSLVLKEFGLLIFGEYCISLLILVCQICCAGFLVLVIIILLISMWRYFFKDIFNK